MPPKRVNAALETSTLVMVVTFAEHQSPAPPAGAGNKKEQALKMLLSIWPPKFWGFLSCSQPRWAGPAVLNSVDHSHLKNELG